MSEGGWDDPFARGMPEGARYDVAGLSLAGAEGVVRFGVMGVVLRDGRARVHLGRLARGGPEAEEDLVSNEALEPEAARRLGVWLIEAAVAAELNAREARGEEHE